MHWASAHFNFKCIANQAENVSAIEVKLNVKVTVNILIIFQ